MAYRSRTRLLAPLMGAVLLASLFQSAAPQPVQADNPRQVALGVSVRAWNDLATLNSFTTSVNGHTPAIWSVWRDWVGGTSSFPTSWMTTLRSRGIVPMVFWQPDDPSQTSAPVVTYTKILAGQFDTYIRSFAQAAKDWGGPVILRLAHEMDGDWFPWGVNRFDNTPANFIAAWKHVVNIFRGTGGVGATNVKFLWSPYTPVGALYPGDAYVDYVGFTAFNWSDWRSMQTLYASAVTNTRKFTKRPMIAAETGSTSIGGDKAAWLKTGYPAIYTAFPEIVAIVYFNVNTAPGQVDWRLTTPAAALDAYKTILSDWRFQGSLMPPTATISSPTYATTTSVPVTLTGTAFGGRTITGYYVSTSATPPNGATAWRSSGQSTITLPTGDGGKQIRGWVRDSTGAISTMATSVTVLDTIAPAAALTAPANSTSSTIAISATGTDAGSGITGYFVSEFSTSPAPSNTGWKYAAPTSFTLSAGNGTKTLYAWTKDRAGNRSAAASATIALAVPGPTVTLTLPALTRTASIAPTLTTTDPTGVGIAAYYLSESATAPTPTAAGWTATKPTAFVLSTGDGTKTVHAWVKNASGVISSMATAQTLLDTSVPSVSLSAPASSTTPTIAITLTGSDAGSGLSGYFVSESSTAPALTDGNWKATAPTSFTLSAGNGTKTLYAWTKDRAGNRSAAASATIALAVPGPTVTYVDDTFTRTLAKGFGTAPTGGAYSVSDTHKFSVDGTAGTVVTSPAVSSSALLNSVSARDIQLGFSFKLDALPVGTGGYWVYAVARRSGTDEYRIKVHVDASGHLRLGISRLVSGTEVDIAPEVTVAGLSAVAGHTYALRARIAGASPTTLQLRVWDAATTDPTAWQMSVTDSSATLQGAGLVGFRMWLSATITSPITVHLDNYSVTSTQ